MLRLIGVDTSRNSSSGKTYRVCGVGDIRVYQKVSGSSSFCHCKQLLTLRNERDMIFCGVDERWSKYQV